MSLWVCVRRRLPLADLTSAAKSVLGAAYRRCRPRVFCPPCLHPLVIGGRDQGQLGPSDGARICQRRQWHGDSQYSEPITWQFRAGSGGSTVARVGREGFE
jgi:hypothetical protein